MSNNLAKFVAADVFPSYQLVIAGIGAANLSLLPFFEAEK